MVEEELVPRFADPVNSWFKLGGTGGYGSLQEQVVKSQKNTKSCWQARKNFLLRAAMNMVRISSKP